VHTDVATIHNEKKARGVKNVKIVHVSGVYFLNMADFEQLSLHSCVLFEVLIAITGKDIIIITVRPCSLIEVHRRFEETWWYY
jgi:hypothetical protein